KENDPDMVLHLGDGEADWYSKDERAKFRSILESHKEAFVVNTSTWGTDYTLARPVKDSGGNYYALLCVDVAIEEINKTVFMNVYINIGVIIGCGLLFIIMFLRWLKAYVIRPLGILEKSVTDYAESAEGKKEPADLLYTVPELGVRNEVLTLAEKVRQLSICMRDYVQQVLNAQKETRGLKEQILQDPLTLVKSKAAYNLEENVLQESIDKGKAEFAILMADMNNLKFINDKYGHERGNVYIIGGCRLICDIFDHSPVYRVGGDEFVVILRGRDFERRQELMKTLQDKVWESMNNESLKPWERYSVAIGMGEYEEGDDVDSVLRRADQAMYAEKIRIKTAAGMPLTRK
ncbi:MAG: GGDEF domain-containing protein, partial [Lachnospiraceae bacterium]